MPHIHTLPGQYDLTVSAYIIRVDGPEPAIVMHMHKILGKYLQFGGHVELHEDPWAAVQHEILEESGYEMSQLEILQPPIPLVAITHGAGHPFPVATLSVPFGDTEHNHTDIAYAFITRGAPTHPVSEHESTDIRLFTQEQLIALSEADIVTNAREISLYIFEECLPNWNAIPATDF
jgi:hypothetical protein